MPPRARAGIVALMPHKALYWDFFGPDAEGTARHFSRHLEQFLEAEQLHGCEIALVSAAAGHHAVECRAPEPAQPLLIDRLRPRRVRALD